MSLYLVTAPTWDEDEDLRVLSPRVRSQRQKQQAKERRRMTKVNADFSWHPEARP